MITWIYRILLNRPSIAPAIKDEVCAVPGCNRIAVEQWFPSVCALRNAAVKVDWLGICAEHDVQANEETTRLFFGDRYDAELADYRSTMATKYSDVMIEVRGETDE